MDGATIGAVGRLIPGDRLANRLWLKVADLSALDGDYYKVGVCVELGLESRFG